MPNPFDVVPDPISRAAMNELMVPGAYKFVRGDDELMGYTPIEGPDADTFPPEPAEFLMISAAYLREGAPMGIKQEYISISEDLPPTGDAAALYRSSIDLRQAKMPRLAKLMRDAGIEDLARPYDIKKFCIDAVRRVEGHLLAAHVIARIASSGILIDALAMPTSVSVGLPLRLRDAIAPHAYLVQPDDPEAKWIRPLLQGAPNMREPAAIAAASFLPKVPAFKAALMETRRHRRQ